MKKESPPIAGLVWELHLTVTPSWFFVPNVFTNLSSMLLISSANAVMARKKKI
jgi:hypothetical protein